MGDSSGSIFSAGKLVVQRDLYINNCNNFKCQQIKDLHYSIRSQRSSMNLYSFGLLICKNEVNINPLFYCPYIHNVYNLDNTMKKKDTLLFDILFTDYSHLKHN